MGVQETSRTHATLICIRRACSSRSAVPCTSATEQVLPSSNPSPLVSWFEPEERAALRASRLPFRTGACPAHASARHAAGQDLTPPYHLPCRSWPQSHWMSAQSLQRASAVWRITERHGVRLAARDRIRAASMRARASRMAAAGREHAESLTSPLLVAWPLAECRILAALIFCRSAPSSVG